MLAVYVLPVYIGVQVPPGWAFFGWFDWETLTVNCFHYANLTNITWRKNGVVITPNENYQQTAGQLYSFGELYYRDGYFSTLTIVQSVPVTDIYGTYSCTFEYRYPRNKTLEIILYRKWTLIHDFALAFNKDTPNYRLHSYSLPRTTLTLCYRTEKMCRQLWLYRTEKIVQNLKYGWYGDILESQYHKGQTQKCL